MAGEQTIDAGTPESRQMAEGVQRAVRCTERLNVLPYDDRVVAAGAVVTSDVPPAVLVAGVPAQMVKSVVDDHTA